MVTNNNNGDSLYTLLLQGTADGMGSPELLFLERPQLFMGLLCERGVAIEGENIVNHPIGT